MFWPNLDFGNIYTYKNAEHNPEKPGEYIKSEYTESQGNAALLGVLRKPFKLI
jgi:hypothetical protein